MKGLIRLILVLGAALVLPACACTDSHVQDSRGQEHYYPCHRFNKCCRPASPKPCECSQTCPCWSIHGGR